MSMQELFTLGSLHLSDFLKDEEDPRCDPVPLTLMYDTATKLVRLKDVANPDFMYGRYWYRSGINASMKAELHGIVESILAIRTFGDNDVWLDIACNDGTLLSYVPDHIRKVGIDPVDDSFKVEAEKTGATIVQDYFSADKYPVATPASVITCIAMFYDLDDPAPFLNDVRKVLKDDGLFVLQMSYTPLMLKQVAFDNICHEHVYYYTLETLKKVLADSGFKVMDCQLNDVNGGSFRVYAMKDSADPSQFGTQPYRDVAQFRVAGTLAHEQVTTANERSAWWRFHGHIEALKKETLDFVVQAKAEGKTVWGYGASTKGNTLLQYFGLDNTLIDGIAERSPYKFGLRTVGTNIPIRSEEEMRAAKPDYLLVLPWHFISEFVAREQDFLAGGGKFIVPCPQFKVISK